MPIVKKLEQLAIWSVSIRNVQKALQLHIESHTAPRLCERSVGLKGTVVVVNGLTRNGLKAANLLRVGAERRPGKRPDQLIRAINRPVGRLIVILK